MESGQLVQVFSSWEVIVSCLLLMFLLPLVFFVASLRSPARRPLAPRPGASHSGGRPAAKTAAAAPARRAGARAPGATPPQDEDSPVQARRARRAEGPQGRDDDT